MVQMQLLTRIEPSFNFRRIVLFVKFIGQANYNQLFYNILPKNMIFVWNHSK